MTEKQTHPVRVFTGVPPRFQTSLPCRILLVDDDDSLRQISAEVLSQSGYEVDAAEDGDVAWETLQLKNYDLLITDQKMPRVCGIELLKKMRAVRMALPVIMATGTPPQAEFNRQPWLRPAAVLLKPYTIPELLGVVRDVLYATEYPREQTKSTLPRRGQSSATASQLLKTPKQAKTNELST